MCAFVDLLNFGDYEILNEFPFTIRKKSNQREINEYVESDGYIRVHLNNQKYQKHRLIAEQFIDNDDPVNKTEVDHINHDKSDYHIDNLRWISHSDNLKNRTSNKGVQYAFVNEISDDSIVVSDYGKHEFDEYYYDPTVDKFYFWNGIQYRELHVIEAKGGSKFVNMKSTQNKNIRIFYSKFKKLYDLI